MPTVPWAEPHDSEAYAATDLPEGDLPGDASVTESADTLCSDESATFAGLSYEASTLDLASSSPTQESRAEGDREIMRLVSSPDGQVTGTLAAAAR